VRAYFPVEPFRIDVEDLTLLRRQLVVIFKYLLILVNPLVACEVFEELSHLSQL